MRISPPPGIARDTMDRLLANPWYGNVRELENVVERSLIINPKGPLNFRLLGLGMAHEEEPPKLEQQEGPCQLDRVIAIHIRRILKQTGGKIHGPGVAAELLGINSSTLRNRMNKLGISYGRSGHGV